MGNTRLLDKPKDTSTRAPEDPSAHLRDNAYKAMKEGGADRLSGQQGGKGKFDNPYKHIEIAGVMLRELDGLKDLPAKDKLQLKDEKGNVIGETTVGERRQQLLKAVQAQFALGIDAADRIDQNKVSKSVISLKEQIEKCTDPVEKEKLQKTADIVDSMKHASSVTRFAYATFLADEGDFVRAKKLLDDAAKKDIEAKNDPVFKRVFERVESELKARQDVITEGNNPLVAIRVASEKRAGGDVAGAEAEYKRAIELAAKIDPKVVEQNLQRIEQQKAANTNNPNAVKELDQQKQAWTALAHAESLASIQLADLLVEQKRYKEGKDLLLKVVVNDPNLVRGDKDFAELLQKARDEGKKPEPFDNPFVHLQNVQEFAKKEDMDGVRRELQAAVNAANKIDRKTAQENKKVFEEQINEEKDPEQRKVLEQKRDDCDSLDHAAAFTKIALARFELANKNYNTAQALLGQAEASDRAFTRKPELEFDKLKEGAKEPSTWEKIWGVTKSILKELACDGVAILAGAGAVILTGWSGPGAVLAGGAAGAAAYTGMKTLVFGEKFSADMLLWGAVDGCTGGLAALARTGLARVGGQIVSKEVAANMAARTGADLTKLAAKEGTMAYGKAVQELGKEGLKQLAKKENLSLWTRMTSHVPLTGSVLGNAEYRAGVNALRGVTYRNLAANALVDGGTVFTASAFNRGIHDGIDYKNGKYQNFGDFASNYGKHVVFDTTKGIGIGSYATSFGYGTLTSLSLNGGREYLLGNNKTFGEWAGKTGFGTMNDMILATPFTIGMSGRLGHALDRMNLSNLSPRWFPNGLSAAETLHGSWVASSPSFYQWWETNGKADQIEKELKEMQRPPANDDELQRWYFSMPGTDEYPTDKPEDQR